MSSVIPGFEYDIFISYRQKDNRTPSGSLEDGWVTEFVNNLRRELESTFKEDISLYFDQNIHDGLLETHDVNASLNRKLKCLIFIPIISQTYCDQKSFAWEHEFLPFLKSAKEDSLGLKIDLENGNVGSRVLPVCIHALDNTDKSLVEAQLGGVIRGIEFIYRSAGVVRPLRSHEDEPKGNLNHTFYPDQINKVSRAIKELITGIQHTNAFPTAVRKTNLQAGIRKKLAWAASLVLLAAIAIFIFNFFRKENFHEVDSTEKAVAVLPFENMSKDPEQDYFSEGITEDILNQLAKISDLKVRSRTSTLQFKGSQKTIPAIGEELGVRNVVAGSIRRVGNQVRIAVQLIDAEKDVHIWSETYDRDFENILALQSEIAIRIAGALNAHLTSLEKKNIEKEASQDITAYDYYLKARDQLNKMNYNRADFDHALAITNEALKRDPAFAKAIALKGKIWFELGSFGVPQKTWQDSATQLGLRAIDLDPSLPDGYLILGDVNSYLGKTDVAQRYLKKAYAVAPNDPGVSWHYGRLLMMARDAHGADLILQAIEHSYGPKDPQFFLEMSNIYSSIGDTDMQERLLLKLKTMTPEWSTPHTQLAIVYQKTGQYDKAIAELTESGKLTRDNAAYYDRLGWNYFLKKDFKTAASYWAKYPEIEATYEDKTQFLPFRHRLAMAYAKMGRKKEADALINEDLKLHSDLLVGKRGMGTWDGFGSIYYDLAVDYAYLKENQKAVHCLDSALHYNFYFNSGYHHDPAFEDLAGVEGFAKIVTEIDERSAFWKRAFSDALSRAKASSSLNSMLK